MTNEKANTTARKTIGILGGMGPDATVYLYDRILKSTTAHKDQDHITTIIYSHPGTPDRTAAILENGPSPLPALIHSAKILEQSGADFILMPCVTAHYYYDKIIGHISIPFIHLLETAVHYIKAHPAKLKKIGLIATDGTIETGLFQDLLEKNGLETVTPGEEGQRLFNEAVYGEKSVKAGFIEEPKHLLIKLAGLLKQKGAEAVIAGCTEIPVALNQADLDIHYINPLQIMAEEAVSRAGGQIRA
jgi:aspartate racemase